MRVSAIFNAVFKIVTVIFMAWNEDHVRSSVKQTRGSSHMWAEPHHTGGWVNASRRSL
jgi:succinate dehydrogenase hydrophobic anchor subunit